MEVRGLGGFYAAVWGVGLSVSTCCTRSCKCQGEADRGGAGGQREAEKERVSLLGIMRRDFITIA